MELKFKYRELMKQENITFDELPSDAKVGIKQIENSERMIKLAESKGKNAKAAIEKLKVNDKWVVREILDYVEDKDSNQGALPNTQQDVAASIEVKEIDKTGLAIEAEFDAVLKNGKSELDADELKSTCPKAYAVVFKHYNPEQENGVETSKYLLKEIAGLETDIETFKLTKK